MTERVFLVIGAGAGIGGHAAARFSRGGYHAVLARRSDDAGLARLVDAIEEDGGKATGTLLDAAADGSIEELVDRVEREIGPIHTVLYNLGAQIGNRTLGDTPHRTFELGWRLGCFGLFRLAHAVTPLMVARGSGTILVTSATAAVRGNAGQHSTATPQRWAGAGCCARRSMPNSPRRVCISRMSWSMDRSMRPIRSASCSAIGSRHTRRRKAKTG